MNNLEAVEKVVERLRKYFSCDSPLIRAEDLLRAFGAYHSEKVERSGYRPIEPETAWPKPNLAENAEPETACPADGLKHGTAVEITSTHEAGTVVSAYSFELGDQSIRGYVVRMAKPGLLRCIEEVALRPTGASPKPESNPDTVSEDHYRLLVLRGLQYLSTQTVQSGVTFEAYRPFWQDLSAEIEILKKALDTKSGD